MTQLSPYLNFNGNCREAMNFYKSCFGGELSLQKIGESAMAANLPQQMEQLILHSTLTAAGVVLMGSDMIGKNVRLGNHIMLCMNSNDGQTIEMLFNKLGKGGAIVTPLHESFWGATYGELTDKYGIQWMFNTSKNQ